MREKKSQIKPLIKFLRYIHSFRAWIYVSVFLSLVAAILNLIGPNALSRITDLITAGLIGEMNLVAIRRICLLMTLLYGLGWVVNYVEGFIMATVSQDITKSMRRDISRKIDRLPLRYFDSHETGNTLSLVTNDVDTVGQMLNQSLSTIILNVALLIGAAVMMLVTNWKMAILGIFSAIVGFALAFFLIAKSQKYFTRQQQDLGSLNGHIEETYGGLLVIKAYNDQEASRRVFREKNEKLYTANWKSTWLSGIMPPLMMFIGNVAYVVVCITGAVLALEGEITFGVIVAFMMYIRNFTHPLQNLAQAFSSMQSMVAACDRIFTFLGEEEMEDESGKTAVIKNVKGDVTFDHVKFGYTKEREIIHDFSSQIKAGQKVAIVGPTGAGKTTIVNLLMRFYDVDGGKITIDGVNTMDMKRETVHNIFGMVLQDTWLIEGTVRENLVYNRENVSDAQLDKVCEAVGLTDLIRQLPHGYDTVLNEDAGISAGQKQLITIARAMLADSPLMILDEATSSVDTRTEQKVQNAMDLLTQGRTSFVIAHRLSTIKNADSILVMKDGDIIESGTHEELMAKNGFYAELYNSQFAAA
ncbi:MAG: ABC transporter ATP-binding protein/permease [Acidaminococcus sp.]|jgi:ATP-binding cassette subfamily B protein|nr:ABC transporter ATP-binding protein/permease [Acidaminococcus sp.]MCI2099781.1 ABC transporter ATP-binding protein/permease [Acidaminococcus sp.]MCI2113949.1 ABC transporter ATP-binding protein/permease [Acidaminococcus sp.]MCI2117094.1 ABC transporter ATP-binding protein/permease [Acidaminococcus sp.]